MSRQGLHSVAITLAFAVIGGCTTGEGEGWVRSDRLYVEDCWNGPFGLQPTFFGANPYREETVLIRVQRGDNLQEVSDGLTVLVNDIQSIRDNDIDRSLPVGLPPGVTPPGVAPLQPAAGEEPPRVSLALYLHASCHAQNGTVYSIDGSLTFASLFSGDPNETDGADRLTEAEFEARFADPRDMQADGNIDPDRVSLVRGYFRFYFQRGQPAQPFP